MQILLRRFDGTTLALNCVANDTIYDIKRQVESREGIPCSLQSLSYGGSILADEKALEDICSTELAQFDLNVELLGGAKKRKKKVYTTPKKIKRKPKKVKLAALKFYLVGANGKVTRTRRECPNKECGAGSFMAAHQDREYCGKCHLTYKH